MKRIVIALFMSALFVNTNAQRKNEIYGTISPSTLTASSSGYKESQNYFGMNFGYNRMFNLGEASNFKLVLGGRVFVCGCDIKDDYRKHGANVDEATEMYVKLQVPVALKYVIDLNEKFSIEPYAGFYMSYCVSATQEIENSSSHTSYDLYDEKDLKLNRAEFGGHIGCDLRIKRFVLGLGYNAAFTDFTSLEGGDLKWSGIDFKCGFRF
ncbi:MAG: hypothetical protein J6Y15_03940 [Bacteroidaceae bacterium]|nr:hypothetical protein [Bacteroidaceae bacterium]